MRNGLSFSNWYAGRHWGNASEWGKVAKGIGHKPDKFPAVGAIGWYKRGHVSYVEDVYSNGTILISEMNTDGHNGFHFATVSPGMSSYPDKFIHLDDVVPVDTTPPTEPTDVRAAAHRGRTAISWRASSDTWGVAGYRVLRNGVPLAVVRGTSYRDGNPLTGQTAVYSVVAFDSAGHTSRPGRLKVLPGTESADRAWVETSAGPAMCGRTGHERRQRLGCRLLVDGGWRAVELYRRTAWGEPSSRAFLTGADGSVVLLPRGRPDGPLVHGPRRGRPRLGSRPHVGSYAATGRRRHLGDHAQRPGPVRTDRIGTAPHRDVLRAHRDRVALGHHGPGVLGRRGRPRLRGDAGRRHRLLPLAARRARRPHRVHRSQPLHPDLEPRPGLRPPARRRPGVPDLGGFVGRPGDLLVAVRRAPRRLPRPGPTGWRTVALPRKAKPGTAGTRAFLTDRAGHVTWCRLVGRTAACAELSASGSRWETGRSTRTVRSLQADNRTWVSLATGPALCGRAGTVRQQRLACQVLTDSGWRTSASQLASWGNAGYRAFVPSGSGVAYCRTVPTKKNGTAVSCTPMSKLEWGATRTSQRVPLVLPDSI